MTRKDQMHHVYRDDTDLSAVQANSAAPPSHGLDTDSAGPRSRPSSARPGHNDMSPPRGWAPPVTTLC